MKSKIAEIRRAVADVIFNSGCGCCASLDSLAEAKERLGKLLRVPKYPDGSGRDFYKYATDA